MREIRNQDGGGETPEIASDFGSAVTRQSAPARARSPRNPYEKNTSPDDADDDVVISSRTQWAKVGATSFKAVGKTQKILVSGVYVIKSDNGEPIFEKSDVNVDSLIEFPDSKTDKILKEVEDFWKNGEIFKNYGFLHRRGYLLYGPPGGGKTSLVQQIIKRIVKQKGIVFMCGHPGVTSMGLKAFREVEPNRNAVCIFEDIDSIIDQYGEDELLSMLDGENQIDKVVNLATTNYPEKLDKRLVSRPRRFDKVIKIGMPNASVREIYFSNKLKITGEDISKWVDATNDFSFAAMAELVISVKCLGNDFEKAVVVIRKLMASKPSSTQSTDEEDEPQKLGFGGFALTSKK